MKVFPFLWTKSCTRWNGTSFRFRDHSPSCRARFWPGWIKSSKWMGIPDLFDCVQPKSLKSQREYTFIHSISFIYSLPDMKTTQSRAHRIMTFLKKRQKCSSSPQHATASLASMPWCRSFRLPSSLQGLAGPWTIFRADPGKCLSLVGDLFILGVIKVVLVSYGHGITVQEIVIMLFNYICNHIIQFNIVITMCSQYLQ